MKAGIQFAVYAEGKERFFIDQWNAKALLLRQM
jgi:hypothetical protein